MSRNPKSNECEFCTKKYTTKIKLVEHIKDHHAKLVFQCDVCNEVLDRSVLIPHMTAHAKEYKQCIANKEAGEDDEDYGFECAHCLEAISTQEDLESHSAKSCSGGDDEEDIKPMIQEVAIRFPTNNTKCYICNKNFTNRSGIRYHLNQVHAKIKEFQCDICQASFGSKNVLATHITGVHLGEKKFKCRQCDKSFKSNANLYVHKKSHDTDYSFVCDICDKAYKFHHHLKQHHITIHAKENLECELCDKIFPSNFNLFLHMKTHKVTQTYECEICHRIFNQKRYYQTHYKNIHGARESAT